MFSSTFLSALAAASLLSMASAQSTTTGGASSTVVSISVPPTIVPVAEMIDVGCFNSSNPLEDHGYYLSQTRGSCQLVCAYLNQPVMALSEGTNCWCGEKKPYKASQISNSSCNTPCKGFKTQDCGGPGLLWVILTHTTDNEIGFVDPPAVSSSTVSSTAKSSKAAATVIETSTTTPSSDPKSGGSSKVGIAVGVTVGVVVLVAIIAGMFLLLRQKRRREVEEEYRRQANINSFTSGGKLHTSNSSMTDSRLDPEFMARRASNGSIADNEDYSRRILKVTNA
ncbi:hypothetical protein K504DRAFT_453037 [Pleomassaria siparia CBS 279.74]|uniref:WSC domain-containing protein n=1 Tax=Pleomassaria siparia CBS 279.74 TaxID=1314801 RepID=A0A6G1JQ70_9PLEO|nr:hypothetical protein K504DRAFT_453037 [Pleomassaria siparia CBS 279.74]